ncbi:MAG: hypothetical protein Tsb009_00850 [Planctomycetaceae bacterium]
MELKNILTATTVGELTLTECPRLEPTTLVSDAIAAMRQMSHGCAVVCDGTQLVGIFTERDFLKVVAENGLDVPMETVMSTNPQTVSTHQTLFEATAYMDRGGYRRLPVVDENGTPAGILDVKAITHFLVEHFPSAIYNQASHAQLIAKHREGA